MALPVLRPLAVLAALAPAAALADPDLAGTWHAVEAERDGAPAPDVLGHRLTFDGDRFAIVASDGAPLYGGSWQADPAASPAAIDFVNDTGEAAGVTWLGAYGRDGARLTIVDNAPDPSRPRPPDLSAPAGSGYVLVRFDRAD